MNRRHFLKAAGLGFPAIVSAQTVAPWLMRNSPATCPWQDGMLAWYAADDLGLADNDPVSSWSDKTGNGNTIVQATGAKQPLYKTGIIGGQPVVRFDGSNDDLLDSSPAGPTSQTLGLTVAMVMNVPTPGAGTHDVFCLRPGVIELRGDNGLDLVWLNGGGGCCCGTGQAIFHAYDRSIHFTLISYPSVCGGVGTQSNSFINGIFTNRIQDSAQRFAVNQICLGARDDSSLFQACDIAEFMCWTRPLKPCELDTVWRYLSTKYSIT